MRNKKNTLHTESLENLLTGYKQAYSRHKHWHTQLLKVLVTSKTPQDKIFDGIHHFCVVAYLIRSNKNASRRLGRLDYLRKLLLNSKLFAVQRLFRALAFMQSNRISHNKIR